MTEFMQAFAPFAQENFILVAIWFVLLGLLGHSYILPLISPVKSLDTTATTLKINKEDALILDIRNLKDYQQGHIVDALQIKQDEWQQGNFKRLEKYKDRPIIVACNMGMTARKVATSLHKQGFDAHILAGGMQAWAGANLPVTK